MVHLNPNDLSSYQKVQNTDSMGEFDGVEFVGDVNVGRAECVLESPKGIIRSLIDENLERICKALEKAG